MKLKKSDSKRHFVGIGDVFAVTAIAALAFSANLAAGQSDAQKPATAAQTSMARHFDAPQTGQQTFSSAEQASQALVTAMKNAVTNNDQQSLLKVLGPNAKSIVSSGDDAEDQNNRAEFLKKYQQMRRLVMEPDGTTTLYIGAENWPTPIPLVHKGSSWYFDTAAGKQEILYRRVGKNELAVIQTCGGLVDAEKEYYSQPHDGETDRQYAKKFFSDPGKQNGLYWETTSGETNSPIGPLVAVAAIEGYPQPPDRNLEPFQGYYFRVLKAQGAKAPGGAHSYIADGKMTRGFAFVAYPAQYRSSGVMTFIVDQDGIVYEKDLGPKTAAIAKAMTKYDPDSTWRKAD
ncbi:MAG: DUF2950 domain-containing protein [Candidatus Sulfotelmatobacter sp.]